jgi:hypothetical protein
MTEEQNEIDLGTESFVDGVSDEALEAQAADIRGPSTQHAAQCHTRNVMHC